VGQLQVVDDLGGDAGAVGEVLPGQASVAAGLAQLDREAHGHVDRDG